MRIIMVGFGTVGQGFIQILQEKKEELARKYNLHPTIIGVATHSHGVIHHPNGLDLSVLQSAIQKGHLNHYPDSMGLVRTWTTMELITNANADLMIEVSVSNLQTGQPATDYVRRALQTRKHVVTANKGVTALHYQEIQDIALKYQKWFRFEGTVMAGTPSIMLGLESLAGLTITKARGIINGSTNFMLTLMEDGHSYEDAMAEAKRLGYLEADPSADVDGWDAAGKALILANTIFGAKLKMSDLQVEGISKITAQDVQDAKNNGEVYKLIAEISKDGGSVKPMRLPNTHPLAGVRGATNAITYSTDYMGEVTLIGAGAGKLQTGFAILSDILAIHREIT
jgi:homoserine dehydrogenase